MQKTWLDSTIESFNIPGYQVVTRLDRLTGPKARYGGVAVYCRANVNTVAHRRHAVSAERTCVHIFSHIGTIALGNWYRPPDCTDTDLSSLQLELNDVARNCIGTILMGDMNVHHSAWLGSSSTSRVGQSLKQLADDFSLSQLVREPTHRAGNRLDLVLTDMRKLCSVSVLPRFTDHHPVRLRLEIAFDVSPPPVRKVWDYNCASWSQMC